MFHRRERYYEVSGSRASVCPRLWSDREAAANANEAARSPTGISGESIADICSGIERDCLRQAVLAPRYAEGGDYEHGGDQEYAHSSSVSKVGSSLTKRA